MLRNPNKVLFVIIILALVLRLGGISHGFPFIFHPDEPTIVRSALAVRFNPNPGHFDWPHLYVYLNYFMYMAFAFIRKLLEDISLKEVLIKFVPILWDDNLIFYLITRILTAVLGALTVVPIYHAGKNMFNDKVGLLAAFGYATFQLQVRNSHYTMPDTAMTFLSAWGVYYCTKILMERDLTNYIFAGFFFGLSTSTKYNAALGLFLIPLAHILSPLFFKFSENYERKRYGFVNTVIILISTIFTTLLGFAIGTPYAILDYKNFIRTDGPIGALWQFKNVGHLIIFEKFDLVLERILLKVGAEVSYLALAAVFVIFLMVLVRIFMRKFNRFDVSLLLLLVPTILLMFYIAGNEKSRSHYFMFLYPFLALLFGYLAEVIFNLIRRKGRFLSIIILALMLFPSLYYSGVTTLSFINNDTRLDLYSWAQKNIQKTDRLAYDADNLKFISTQITNNSDPVPFDKVDGSYKYFISGEHKNPGPRFVKVLEVSDRFRVGPSIAVYRSI